MYLVYRPDGQPEQRFHVNINRLPLEELKMIQRASGLKIAMFQQNLMLGDVDALQALLWVYLHREHPTLRVDDVRFCLDELQLQRDRDEWQAEIAALEEDTDMPAMDRAAALAYARSELRTAPDAPGKAPATASTPADPEPTVPDALPTPPPEPVAIPTEPTPAPAAASTPVLVRSTT
jgi:outer membrane biosynthesis protein TonB